MSTKNLEAVISLRLPARLLEEVDAIAKAEEAKRSHVVRRLLKRALRDDDGGDDWLG